MSDDMALEWRPVPGFPEYAVSNYGQVIRTVDRRPARKGKVLVPWLGNHGYDTVCLVLDGRLNRRLVHRLVCEAFHGPAPGPGYQVAHNDGTRRNHRADNLRWATRSENMADCLLHGTRAMGDRHGRTQSPERTPRGERHGHAKITAETVAAIRASGRDVSGVSLAGEYGISTATISLIRNRKIWRHIEG